MSRLTAEQILNLNILSLESSGEDSCDESEIDMVEADFRTESGSDYDDDDELIEETSLTDNASLAVLKNHSEIIFRQPMNNPATKLSKSNTFDMIQDDNASNNIILGRVNKKEKIPFEWFDKPNKIFLKSTMMHSSVIRELKDEKSIELFFRMLIPIEMVDKITFYTNKKISSIELGLKKEANLAGNYSFDSKITSEELYAYIGLLILLGITKKSDVSVESLWCRESLHYAPFAVATMARHRFQLISRFLTFDDLDTRTNRTNHKFYKMSEIFNDFKDNLALIKPSFLLCVDEELYAFRGILNYILKIISLCL